LDNIKPIAIYLPQFHPFEENDRWWGKGFTEWTNVTKATPRFKGHYQPHLPADLGFYDLRLEESRLAQEELAKEYGIHGFCYYHYWFDGKPLMQEPINRKLKNPNEDFPFMLCFANENWTRAWDGLEREVLISQNHSEEDDIAHMHYLCNKFFKDIRYIRHEGKPVFIVYRPKLFPDIKKTIDVWRNIARELGIGELHLGYMQSWGVNDDPNSMGFDFAIEFQPNFPGYTNLFDKIVYKINELSKKNFNITLKKNRIFDYDTFVKLQMKREFDPLVSPGIVPMWDNSSRRKTNAFIFSNSNPTSYGNWLKHIRDNYPWKRNAENFLFINAWNEWAEGNHLEPCQKWGRKYLEKTKEILSGVYKEL